MADAKYVDVLVTATRRFFIGGKMVGPGEKAGAQFRFTGDKLPDGVSLDESAAPEKAKPLNGDTKPKDAQEAVKAKAAGAQG